MAVALYNKHRPQQLSQVRGQPQVISALKRAVEASDTQSFLFYGPSGTGKTTLARIVSRQLGCAPKDRMEIDAATYTGVEDVRRIKEVAQYRPFGESGHRSIIIDEAHRLSRNAWDALLKVTEEPPPHLSWFLCTTDIAKVPGTVLTRFTKFKLESLSDDDISDLVTDVAKLERISLPMEIRGVIVREAHGSPREALNNLSLCRDVKSRAEAVTLLKTAVESDVTIELCRFLVKGGSWVKAMALVDKLGKENPEGVRIIICNYLGAALKGAKGDREAAHLLGVLDNFSTSFNQSEGIAPLVLAIGRTLFGGQDG